MTKAYKILILLNELLSSDAGFESTCVELDIINKVKISKREKAMAEFIAKIYKIVHSAVSECEHPDWQEETDKLLKYIETI